MSTLVSYRRLWWAAVGTVSLPGVVLGVMMSPAPAAIVAVSLVAVGVGAEPAGLDLARSRWTDAGAGAALVFAGAPVWRGSAFLLMLTVALTSAPLLGRVLCRSRSVRVPPLESSSRGSSGDVAGACWDAMSGDEICQLWSSSFSWVKGPDVSQRILAAGLRCGLLDELERRGGASFTEWLSRRPSPASEPRWVEASRDGPAA